MKMEEQLKQNNDRPRLTIRVGRGTLSFSVEKGQEVIYEPYVVKSGVSMAANLREAFKTADLLQLILSDKGQAWPLVRTKVALDTDVMMVPIEQFDESDMTDMYRHAFPDSSHDAVVYDVLPDLNAVAVFSVNRDLRLVLNDHFPNVRLMPIMGPVWRHLHQRSFTGRRQKLYAYFHERRMEVFAFRQNRFKFCNSFEAVRSADVLFFLLYAWKQLQLQPEQDELHIVGDIPGGETMLAELRRYVQNVYVINPVVDFNNHSVTAFKDMPYDLMTLYAWGR